MGCPDQLAVKQDFLDQDGRLLSSLATKEQADEILDKLGRVETGIDTSIPGAIANIIDSLISIIRDPMIAAIDGGFDVLEAIFTQLIKSSENVITQSIESGTSLLESSIEGTKDVLLGGINAAKSIVNDVKEISQNIEDIATAGFDTLDNLINSTKDIILQSLATGERLWRDTLEAAQAIAPYLESIITGAQDFLENLINQYFQTLRSLIAALPTDFPDFKFDDGQIISEIKKVDRKLGTFPFDCNTVQPSDGLITTVSEFAQTLICGGSGGSSGNDETTEDLSDLSTRQLLERMADAIGINEFPGEVPKTLLNSGDNPEESGTETIPNLTQFVLWIVKQMDALLGEFPIKMEIKDSSLLEDGNQSIDVELKNVAETLAEIYSLGVVGNTTNAAILSSSLKTGSEALQGRIAAIRAFEVARANAEFLGYNFTEKGNKIDVSFDLKQDKSIARLLRNKKYNYKQFKFDGEEYLPDFLQKFMFASSIVEAVYYRTDTSELDRLRDTLGEETNNPDELWDEFVKDVNNPESFYNQGQFTAPKIRDTREE